MYAENRFSDDPHPYEGGSLGISFPGPSCSKKPPDPSRVVACAGALVNIKQNRGNEHSRVQGGGSTAWLAVEELTAGFPLRRLTASTERMAATVLVTVPSVLPSLKSHYH